MVPPPQLRQVAVGAVAPGALAQRRHGLAVLVTAAAVLVTARAIIIFAAVTITVLALLPGGVLLIIIIPVVGITVIAEEGVPFRPENAGKEQVQDKPGQSLEQG